MKKKGLRRIVRDGASIGDAVGPSASAPPIDSYDAYQRAVNIALESMRGNNLQRAVDRLEEPPVEMQELTVGANLYIYVEGEWVRQVPVPSGVDRQNGDEITVAGVNYTYRNGSWVLSEAIAPRRASSTAINQFIWHDPRAPAPDGWEEVPRGAQAHEHHPAIVPADRVEEAPAAPEALRPRRTGVS